MNKKKQCELILQRLRERNPHPKTELIYHSPFELLVAVMLSAQATDKKVNEVTAYLFSKANSPQSILNLGEEELKTIIRPINYYATKAKHIIHTCGLLINLHAGKVPSQRESLEALPGVGRKTANVVLNIIFNQPTLAVDTHIFRVSHRTGLSEGRTPLLVERDLLKLIHEKDLANAHHWLILHGRYMCIAKRPLCYQCPIRDLCSYPQKTLL